MLKFPYVILTRLVCNFLYNVGFQGEPVIECAYVRSCATEAAYFANPVVLGRCGIEQNLGFGKLNPYESKQVQEAIPILVKNIEEGINFVIEKVQMKPPKKPDSPKPPSKSTTKTKC